MPWRECPVMEERLRFVARLEGDGMSQVCREFGISRKTTATRMKGWRHFAIAPWAGALRQSTTRSDRAADRRDQAREAALGRLEDQGVADREARR